MTVSGVGEGSHTWQGGTCDVPAIKGLRLEPKARALDSRELCKHIKSSHYYVMGRKLAGSVSSVCGL